MKAAFQDQENLYLVLELMPGGDLRRYLKRAKAVTEEQASIQNLIHIVGFIIACVMCGLEYLHTKGIVHRDIKPANLVIDTDGYVRLADFGISQAISSETMIDTSGTPGYMGMNTN